MAVDAPLFLALDAGAGKMYWSTYEEGGLGGSDGSSIYRANLDGSGVERVVKAKAGSAEFVLHPEGGKIYWEDMPVPPTWDPETESYIRRANLDGSNVEDLVTIQAGSGVPQLLDVSGREMYWSKVRRSTSETNIYRTGLDGSDTEALLEGVGPLWNFALDPVRGEMYWMEDHSLGRQSDRTRAMIRRADLDGSNVQDLLGGIHVSWPVGFALNGVGGMMYWTHPQEGIFQAELNGSSVDLLVAGVSPLDFVLDPAGGKMYWTDDGTGGWWDPDDSIRRANLDGSDVEVLLTGLLKPSIALHTPQVRTTISISQETPRPFVSGLESNAPNPFNSTTEIPYRLSDPGPVRLEVCNVLGQPVRILVDEFQTPGSYRVSWDARDQRGAVVATGVYISRLLYPGGVQTRRLLYLE